MTLAGLTLPAPPLVADARSRQGKPGPMDEARFEAFYRSTASSLWSYLFRLTGDAAAADDLLQKTFFRFLSVNPPVASDEHRRRWVFRTATNLALDHFRETTRRRNREAPELPMQLGGSAENRELRHDMMKTFSELKPRERALLWLAHVEEADHEHIGEALGVKTGSVKVLLFRARKRLAELLTKKGLGPAGGGR